MHRVWFGFPGITSLVGLDCTSDSRSAAECDVYTQPRRISVINNTTPVPTGRHIAWG